MDGLFLIILGVLSRIIPHLPNLTTMTGITLAASARLKSRWGIFIPFLTLLISNILLALMAKNINYLLYYSQAFVYFAYLIIFFLGLTLKKRRGALAISLVAFWSAIIFYLITNFGVWLEPNSIYPRTLNGLLLCYLMGLPFVKNAILGDILFSILILKYYPFSLPIFKLARNKI